MLIEFYTFLDYVFLLIFSFSKVHCVHFMRTFFLKFMFFKILRS